LYLNQIHLTFWIYSA